MDDYKQYIIKLLFIFKICSLFGITSFIWASLFGSSFFATFALLIIIVISRVLLLFYHC